MGVKSDSKMNRGQQATLIGAIALILGALLPWASFKTIFGITIITGFSGNGILTGGIGALLLLGSLFYRGRPGTRYSYGSSSFALIAGLIAVKNFFSFSSPAAAVGSGVYISVMGAIVSLAGGLQVIPDQADPVTGDDPGPNEQSGIVDESTE